MSNTRGERPFTPQGLLPRATPINLYQSWKINPLPVMENQPFTRGICPKQFSSRPYMLRHQRTHKCSQCQAKFSRSDLLQNPVKTHGKKRRFEHDPMVDPSLLHVLDGSDGSTVPNDLITLRSERTASTTTAFNPEITVSVNSAESCPEPCNPQSTSLSYVTHIHATGVDRSRNFYPV